MSIIIPTKDRVEDLRRLVLSIQRQTCKDFQLIVVNNGEHNILEDLEDLIEGVDIKVIEDKTPNLPHLFNYGLADGNAPIIGYLNDDTEVGESWVRVIKESFKSYPQVVAVGGPAVSPKGGELYGFQRRLQKNWFTRLLFHVVNVVLYEKKFFQIGYLSNWGTYSIGGSMRYSTQLSSPFEVDALSVTNMAI